MYTGNKMSSRAKDRLFARIATLVSKTIKSSTPGVRYDVAPSEP